MVRANEKTPLRGSEDHASYVYMSDPNRAYKKKVRQLQCYIAGAVLGLLGLGVLVAMTYAIDREDLDESINSNGSLSGHLRSSADSSPIDTNELVNDLLDEEDVNHMISTNQNVLGKPSKSVIKKTTSFMVNFANVTARVNGDVIYESYNEKPPLTIPLDSAVDPNEYSPSTNVVLVGNYEGDVLSGTVSVPLKSTGELWTTSTLEVNFAFSVSIQWAGVLELDPNRKYNCKVLFQSYAKLPNDVPSTSTLNLQASSEVTGEQCSILMVGTFYKRPFYCPLTPWWCNEGIIFYWAGNTKLIFTKPAPVSDSMQIQPRKSSVLSSPVLGKSGDTVVEKLFASVTVLNGKISGNVAGNETLEVLNGGPPVDIYLDRIINPNAFDMSIDLTFQGTPKDDSTVTGTFSIPYFPTPGSPAKKMFTGNFTFDVVYKYGGSIGIINPTKTYTCKMMFPSVKKSANANVLTSSMSPATTTLKGKTPFGESCALQMSGTHYQPSFFCFWWCSKEKIFQWSGDAELTIKYKYNASNPESLDEVSYKKLNSPVLGKSGNTVVDKSFASVTVLNGKISGSFDAANTIEVFSGVPPRDIHLGHIVNPNAFDTSIDLTFQAMPIDDSVISGTFSIPYFPTAGSPSNRKQFVGNFTFDIVYKYGGSIGIINPLKAYSCKIMFPSPKKKSSNPSFPSTTLKGKTAFGETCAIMMSGRFDALDKNIYHWSGDAELTLKYKYNASNPESFDEVSYKKLNSPVLGKSGNTVVDKLFASVTILNGKISGSFDAENTTEVFSGVPPPDIHLGHIVNPNAFDTSIDLTFQAMPIDDSVITGTFSIPYFPTVGSPANRKKFVGNFTFDIVYKYGGSIGIINPLKAYSCKIMFPSPKKKSSNPSFPSTTLKGKTAFGETCAIMMSGTFDALDKTIYHWSGDAELTLKYKYNISNHDTVNEDLNSNMDIPTNRLKMAANVPQSSVQQPQKNDYRYIGKVLSGWIKINSDSGISTTQTIWSGNFPFEISMPDIFLTNKTKLEISHLYYRNILWSGSLYQSHIEGEFSVPWVSGSSGWINGKFRFQLEPPQNAFLNDILYQGVPYSSHVTFRQMDRSENVSYVTALKENHSEGGWSANLKAPLVLLGRYSKDHKIFIWNGTFIMSLINSKTSYSERTYEQISPEGRLASPQQAPVLKYNDIESSYNTGRRYGGRIQSGWVAISSRTGIFSTMQTIWSGQLPFEIPLPIFWTPTVDNYENLSEVYSHQIIWSCSVFRSTIQGSFSFPQYIGHGPSHAMQWINGKFSFQLQPDSNLSIYDLVVPSIKYNSRLHFHYDNSNEPQSFVTPQKGDPNEDIASGVRAPLILLGKYSPDRKSFIWNGSFVAVFTKTTKDLLGNDRNDFGEGIATKIRCS